MVHSFPFAPSPLPLFLVSENYNRKEREDSAKRRKATQGKNLATQLATFALCEVTSFEPWSFLCLNVKNS